MKTRIDGFGRVVIPKPLREQYRFEAGTEVEIVTTADGITLEPVMPKRRIVRRGRIAAVDTGAGAAAAEILTVDRVGTAHLEGKGALLA